MSMFRKPNPLKRKNERSEALPETLSSETKENPKIKKSKLPKKIEFSIDMQKKISPSIDFNLYDENENKELSTIKALYIQSYNEVFSSDIEEDQIIKILTNINTILKNSKNLIIFFDMLESESNKALDKTKNYLGKSDLSALIESLETQLENQIEFSEFLSECEEANINTVHMGGVYGSACVWDNARKMAINIFTKKLGDFHPNVRFIDVDNNFQFENAIICPNITEGHTDENILFDQFICFPGNEPFRVITGGIGHFEKALELLKKTHPNLLGTSYENFSELHSPQNYSALCETIKATLNNKITPPPQTKTPSTTSNILKNK